jgi:hypothetical protein
MMEWREANLQVVVSCELKELERLVGLGLFTLNHVTSVIGDGYARATWLTSSSLISLFPYCTNVNKFFLVAI